MDILTRMNAKVDILNAQAGVEGSGQPTRGRLAEGYNAVPCVIHQRGGSESVLYSGDRTLRNGVAMFLPNVTLNQTSRIQWGSRTLQVDTIAPVYIDENIISHFEVQWVEVVNG